MSGRNFVYIVRAPEHDDELYVFADYAHAQEFAAMYKDTEVLDEPVLDQEYIDTIRADQEADS